MEPIQEKEKQPKKDDGMLDGLFTGKLSWWQILIGLIFVAFLVYQKIPQ